MARIFLSGAELNSLKEVTSTGTSSTGTIESSSAQKKSGSRSWRATRAGAGFGRAEVDITRVVNSLSMRFSLFVVDNNADADELAIVEWTGNTLGEFVELRMIQNDTNFDLKLTNFGGPANTSTTISGLSYGVWHDICMRSTANTDLGATETLILRVGNVEQTSAAANFATGGWTDIAWGLTRAQNSTSEVFIDDVIIDNTNANINDGRYLEFLQPNGDDTTGWGTFGAGATHTARVTDNDDATGIRATGSSAVSDRFNMTDVTAPGSSRYPTAILGVRLGNTTDTVGASVGFRLSGTDDVTAIDSLTAITTLMSAHIATKAPGGADWAKANINDTLIVANKAAGLATDQVSIEEMWAYFEVENRHEVTTMGITEEFE